MDALEIEKAVVAGCDWGARTANIVAALWPERCKGLVSVSGYLIGSREANSRPLPPNAELKWWYRYYFATERGRAGYEENRREFAKLIWQLASPNWKFYIEARAPPELAFLRQAKDVNMGLAPAVGPSVVGPKPTSGRPHPMSLACDFEAGPHLEVGPAPRVLSQLSRI